jgi:hypothetical protein
LEKGLEEAKAKDWTVVDMKQDWKSSFRSRRSELEKPKQTPNLIMKTSHLPILLAAALRARYTVRALGHCRYRGVAQGLALADQRSGPKPIAPRSTALRRSRCQNGKSHVERDFVIQTRLSAKASSVTLIWKDGKEKLRRATSLPSKELFSVVEAMVRHLADTRKTP